MGAILALLRALPLKDYIYFGAIIVIVLGGWGYVHSKETQAVLKDRANAAKVASVTKDRNEAITALATNGITKIGDRYVATITAPPPADSPHVFVCKRTAPSGGSAVPEAAGHPGVPAPAADVPAAAPVDIGPPIDRTGRDADALVLALQDTVRTLVAAMQKAAAP